MVVLNDGLCLLLIVILCINTVQRFEFLLCTAYRAPFFLVWRGRKLELIDGIGWNKMEDGTPGFLKKLVHTVCSFKKEFMGSKATPSKM